MTLEPRTRRLVLITLEKSTVIHRPSDEVFAFVADQTNAASWQSGIVEVRRLTDGPPGVGSRHIFTRTLMGRRMTGENAVSYTHLRAHETDSYLVCRLLLEK